MLRRLSFVLLVTTVFANSAAAQIVRFETSQGDFDMVLNPTNNPLLQEHVENIVRHVDDNRYSSSWINRAAEGFVLQMGGFYSHTKRPPLTIESTRSVVAFNPIEGHPASSISGLSNTVGTVSMALSGGSGGTNRNSGTSSFFVNLTSNTFLDTDFTVFAAISDMSVINQIMALTQVDRTTDPMFGVDAGNLAFKDVPLLDNGQQVFIKRAFVIDDTLAVAKAKAGVAPLMAQSAAAFNSGGSGSLADLAVSNSAGHSTNVVPEPAGVLLAVVGVLGSACFAARRRRS